MLEQEQVMAKIQINKTNKLYKCIKLIKFYIIFKA